MELLLFFYIFYFLGWPGLKQYKEDKIKIEKYLQNLL